MTVQELIEKLQKVDGNLKVLVEGCDCIGEANDVTVCIDYSLYGISDDLTCVVIGRDQ